MVQVMNLVRRLHRQEDALVAPVVALCLVALLGFVAISVDAGVLFVQRTQLQKAVDAAALAGAYDIGVNGNSAADALTYAASNGVNPQADPQTRITVNQLASTFGANDSWTVTARRQVPLVFAPVLGIPNSTVTATALAISSPAASVDSSYLLPYAVWNGNANPIHPGSVVAYRDNCWDCANVLPTKSTNTNWQVGNNDFKGYFHAFSGIINQGGQLMASSHGGNTTGQEPISTICSIIAANGTAVMPVIGSAYEMSGTIYFNVQGFVTIIPSMIQPCQGGNQLSADFPGTVVNWTTWRAKPGGNPVPGGASLRVLKLWQ